MIPSFARLAATLPPVAWAAVWLSTGLLTGPAPHWAIPTLILVVAIVMRRPAFLLLVAGLIGAGAVARTSAASCASVLGQGRQALWLDIEDTPSNGVTTARPLHMGCGGLLRVRFRTETPAKGGDVVLAVGSIGFGGHFTVGHVRVISHRYSGRSGIRAALSGRIRSLFGRRAGLVEAVIIGNRAGVDPTLRDGFVNSGLAHLLAISGLHVGLVAAWVLMICRPLGQAAWPVALLLVWGYVSVLGFPAPATRAACFVTATGLAERLSRLPRRSAVLASALLVILILDPAAARSVGTWLSVAAVIGTASTVDFVRAAMDDVHPVTGLVATSVGATVSTAPLTAGFFGSVAPIGVLANLVAVPLTAVMVPALILSLVLGSFMASGAALVITALETVARLSASVPMGHITTRPGVPASLPWIALLLFWAWLIQRRPRVSTVVVRVMAVLVALVWVGPVSMARSGRLPSDELQIYFMDVGQGDAALVRTPQGSWIAVDGGPRVGTADAGRDILDPFLRSHGVRRLRAIILSHGDADHLGGIPHLVRRFRPEAVFGPGQGLGTDLFADYLNAIDESEETDLRPVRAGDVIFVDSVRLDILHPTPGWMNRNIDPNENSVVFVLTYRGFSALFTGDAGLVAESLFVRSGLPDVDLMKVGHHGSRTSSGDLLLRQSNPEIAVISVGRNNRYGHPHREVIDRLARNSIRTVRTDLQGTLTVATDGDYIVIQSHNRNSIAKRARWLIRRLSRSRDSL